MLESTQDAAPSVVPAPKPLDTRPGGIFRQALRDTLPAMFAWGLAYGALILLVVVLYPALQQNSTLIGVVRSLGLMGMLTDKYTDVNALTSFPGYLALEALGWAPLILSVYMIPQALSIVSREEERGTLDILLSTPLSRSRLLTEKMLAIAVSLVGILTIMWSALWLGTLLVDSADIPLVNSIAGVWHIVPISLVIASVTLLLSVSLRTSRSAGTMAAMIVILSYFTRALTDLINVQSLDFIRQLSIFYYYKSLAVLTQGFLWQNDLLLLGVALVLFTLALVKFQRRDLGI
jgi:ABC-type transport system involved in multi-copper enzyme maturation permease subunit